MTKTGRLRLLTTSLAAAAMMAVSPPQAAGQGVALEGRFLAGVTWGSVATLDSKLGTQYKVAPFFRWNSRREGWGPSFGLSWYEADLRVPVGGEAAAAGSVNVRPVMAGVGYSILTGRLRTTLGLVGGYAFNRAKVDRPLPADTTVTVDIANAWAVGPKADLVLALTRRLALVGSIGYVYANPDITVRVWDGGRLSYAATDHARADAVTMRVGAAISLF